jgi:hypothetical protein
MLTDLKTHLEPLSIGKLEENTTTTTTHTEENNRTKLQIFDTLRPEVLLQTFIFLHT